MSNKLMNTSCMALLAAPFMLLASAEDAETACPTPSVTSDQLVLNLLPSNGVMQLGRVSEVNNIRSEGTVLYDASQGDVVVCDGTNWTPLSGGGSGNGAGGGGGGASGSDGVNATNVNLHMGQGACTGGICSNPNPNTWGFWDASIVGADLDIVMEVRAYNDEHNEKKCRLEAQMANGSYRPILGLDHLHENYEAMYGPQPSNGMTMQLTAKISLVREAGTNSFSYRTSAIAGVPAGSGSVSGTGILLYNGTGEMNGTIRAVRQTGPDCHWQINGKTFHQ